MAKHSRACFNGIEGCKIASFKNIDCAQETREAVGENSAEWFDELVRCAFVAEFKAMGIEWNTPAVLTSAKDAGLCAQDALRRSLKIVRRVQKRLEFPRLFAQIKQQGNFDGICKMVLANASSMSIENYAVCKGEVLPLMGENWFIALLNSEGVWEPNVLTQAVPVTLSYGNFYFTERKLILTRECAIEKIFENCSKWWMFPEGVGPVKAYREHLMKEMNVMMKNDIKILYSKKLHEVKTIDNFKIES